MHGHPEGHDWITYAQLGDGHGGGHKLALLMGKNFYIAPVVCSAPHCKHVYGVVQVSTDL